MEQQATINVTIEGVKGGASKTHYNKGKVTIDVDDPLCTISVDAFEGSGNNFKRRDKCLIHIRRGDEDYWMDFKVLCDVLAKSIEQNIIHSFQNSHYIRTQKKREFILSNLTLFKLYDKEDDRNSLIGKEIAMRARKMLYYSNKTSNCDISWILLCLYRKMQEEIKLKQLK